MKVLYTVVIVSYFILQGEDQIREPPNQTHILNKFVPIRAERKNPRIDHA
jgi:hypothetical protein